MQALHDSAAGMLEIREPSTTPPIWPAGNHKIANTVTYKYETKQPYTNTNTKIMFAARNRTTPLANLASRKIA